MKVALVARYPVKSLRGESIEVIELDDRGVVGDRLWALRADNGEIGSGLGAGRLPRLTEMSSKVLWGVHTVLQLPDGREFATIDPKIDDAVSEFVGQSVTVVKETETPHFDASPLHLITTSTLRWLGIDEADWMRTRANVLVETEGDNRAEDDWIGRRIKIGTSEVEITGPAVRRVMSGQAQGEPPARPELPADHDVTLGAYARVINPGVIGTGDPLLFR
ncbi:MAG: MOSC N-terminal beta barrel domain-containing protein [Actinomycetota bacterium]|nr:MOSC N-terminal beta barrel domain-containing protein [Actinomycetota bacterium]